DPMPIVAEGTKWRSIGAQCQNHSDTPAVANCDRCSRPVCALCLLEASQGTFCSSECMSAVAEQAPPPVHAPGKGRGATVPQIAAPAERAALQGKPVFKFTEPPKSNKTALTVALAVFAVVLVIGGYYTWNITNTKIDATYTDPNPPIVTPPVDPQPVVVNPVVPPPVIPKPVNVTPPVKVPDPVTPADPVPAYYVKPKPIPRAIPMRTINPWSAQAPGSWYRLKITRGGKTSYQDIGLKEKGADFYVLATQTSADGQAGAVTEARTQAAVVYPRGEKVLIFDNQQFTCEIRTSTTDDAAPKTWVALSSKFSGAVLKSEGPDGAFTARKVWQYSMRVKSLYADCLVVEGDLEVGGIKKAVKNYYSSEVPLPTIRQESSDESSMLVDLGEDWAKRPAFPK
ncbi:MAG TPA: B-box zinc finger protein, partial [Planctomycetota bacterium]|nr:B-box zinc finger protein [Planctomycetota bacterium]